MISLPFIPQPGGFSTPTTDPGGCGSSGGGCGGPGFYCNVGDGSTLPIPGYNTSPSCSSNIGSGTLPAPCVNDNPIYEQ